MKESFKCAFCEGQVGSACAMKYKNQYYHPECYQLKRDREDLQQYICSTFGLLAPGSTINSQIKTFVSKYHYTYKGMTNALRYFYEVKKNSTGYGETIGIIPYIYTEANEYYDRLNTQQKLISEQVEQQLLSDEVVIAIKKPNIDRVKNVYDLDKIGGTDC